MGDAPGERRDRLGYLVFVLSMCLVPLAANTMTFAITWELMSLASYFLVLHDRESKASVYAGWVYAVMTHAGLACLLAGMLLLGAWTGSPRFEDWRVAAPALSGPARNAAFVLLALGFAGKAGVIPLHVWLPLAHPAAPSHVSALMSGVMIKLGVYGLMRVSLDWLGVGPAWWGVAILIAGATSSVIGVLYALVDHDLKRLLAFHSIENIGIILLGIGSAVLYRGAGLPSPALLGLAAALYHTVNHAAFKALLFLGAGAVVHATRTRNMEDMGGLIKRMPWTAACFLVGSVAIAALPPLNGFVSEWLTFVTLFQSRHLAVVSLDLVFILGIASLALTGGLAMACFVKAFGITFLALPRSDAAARAHEAPWTMRLAMLALAASCVALGLGPTLVIPVLGTVAASVLAEAPPATLGDWLTLHVSGGYASLSTLAIAVALGVGLLVPLVALPLVRASRRTRLRDVGMRPHGADRADGVHGYRVREPVQARLRLLLPPYEATRHQIPPGVALLRSAHRVREPGAFDFHDWLYRPALDLLRAGARAAGTLQSGSANLYLAYILAALLLMLVLA
jgi:hydrogenase-4 component B